MNSKTKTAALTAGLALVAAPAFADKPAEPGKQGRENAAKQQTKSKQPKGVGFSLAGVDLSGLAVTDGKLGGPFTLDPTSANKHARTFLGLTPQELAGEDTVTLGAKDDAVRLRFNGVTDGSDEGTDIGLTDVLATDRIKVVGKVTRVRKGDSTTVRQLNIRKITITRSTEESGS